MAFDVSFQKCLLHFRHRQQGLSAGALNCFHALLDRLGPSNNKGTLSVQNREAKARNEIVPSTASCLGALEIRSNFQVSTEVHFKTERRPRTLREKGKGELILTLTSKEESCCRNSRSARNRRHRTAVGRKDPKRRKRKQRKQSCKTDRKQHVNDL